MNLTIALRSSYRVFRPYLGLVLSGLTLAQNGIRWGTSIVLKVLYLLEVYFHFLLRVILLIF